MLMTLEPVMLLTAVPGEVAFPVAGALGAAVTALWRASRSDAAESSKDARDAIIAIKDNQTTVAKLVELIQEKRVG